MKDQESSPNNIVRHLEDTLSSKCEGIHDIEVGIHGGIKGRFTLSIPSSYAHNTPRPLVCILHYAGQPTRFYGRPLLEQLYLAPLDHLEPIIFAPESLGGQWHSAENESFVMNILNAALKSFMIDRKKITISGYSMGGVGVFHYINAYPDIFSNGISLAGCPSGRLEPKSPILMLASVSDDIFSYEQIHKECAIANGKGYPVTLTSVSASNHYDVQSFSAAMPRAIAWLNAQWNRER